MKQKMRRTFFLMLLIVLAACSGVYQHKVDFDPTEPIRVAILPFAHLDEQGNIINPDVDWVIDDVSVVSSKYEELPAARVAKIVAKKLSRTGLDIVSSDLVAANFSHAGYVAKGNYDLAKINTTSPKKLCDLLSCDALIYGQITKWERAYYGVEATADVGINLRLVAAKDGKELFSIQAEDSTSRGFTKGPTGYSSLVLEPIKGLDNAIIDELAFTVVEEALKPLYTNQRPEFLESPAPAIFAAAHDSFSGQVKRESPLTVILFGSPNKTAYFSIGDKITSVPMYETDKGHYIGEYFPLEQDQFSNERIKVSLSDKFGRVSTLELSGKKISVN